MGLSRRSMSGVLEITHLLLAVPFTASFLSSRYRSSMEVKTDYSDVDISIMNDSRYFASSPIFESFSDDTSILEETNIAESRNDASSGRMYSISTKREELLGHRFLSQQEDPDTEGIELVIEEVT